MATSTTEISSFISKLTQLASCGFRANLTFDCCDGRVIVNLNADLGRVDLPPTTFQQPYNRPSQVKRRLRRKKARENTNKDKSEVTDDVLSRKPLSQPTLDHNFQQHIPSAHTDSPGSAKTVISEPSSKLLLPAMMTEHASKSLKDVNAFQECYASGYNTHETHLLSSLQPQEEIDSYMSQTSAYEDFEPGIFKSMRIISEKEYKTIMRRMDEEARLIDAGL